MKKLLAAGFAVAVLMLATASDAGATCFRRGGHGGCATTCNEGYGGCGASPCYPATCTVYQPVWKEREEMVTVYKTVTKEVEFKYTACVPVTKAEKRKVCTYQWVNKEVEFAYIECVPVTTVEKRKCLKYTCVPTVVECEVPCWSTVMVPTCTPPSCCNPCGSVSYCCQRVCTMQKVQRTVMKSVATEVEVSVPVTTFNRVEKKGKRTICECVQVEKEVVVNICSYEMQERVGKRLVCECVSSQEKRMVKYCEMVATQAPAPVSTGCDSCNTGCYTGCNTGCNTGCGRGCFSGHRGCFGGHRGGCFGGHRGCGSGCW
jgi:hypothetical protein